MVEMDDVGTGGCWGWTVARGAGGFADGMTMLLMRRVMGRRDSRSEIAVNMLAIHLSHSIRTEGKLAGVGGRRSLMRAWM